MDIGELIQVILETVLAIALPILIGYAVMWLRAKQKEIMAGLTTEQRYMLENAVDMAVRAAKQSGLAGYIKNEGRIKKRFAIDAAERYLRSMGLGGLDLDVLSDMIEAEVYRQFRKPEPPVVDPPTVEPAPSNQPPVSW